MRASSVGTSTSSVLRFPSWYTCRYVSKVLIFLINLVFLIFLIFLYDLD